MSPNTARDVWEPSYGPTTPHTLYPGGFFHWHGMPVPGMDDPGFKAQRSVNQCPDLAIYYGGREALDTDSSARLRSLLCTRGITHRAAADALGLGLSVLRHYLYGKKAMPRATYQALLELLESTPRPPRAGKGEGHDNPEPTSAEAEGGPAPLDRHCAEDPGRAARIPGGEVPATGTGGAHDLPELRHGPRNDRGRGRDPAGGRPGAGAAPDAPEAPRIRVGHHGHVRSICKCCKGEKTIVGRGLCCNCYKNHKADGTLERFPAKTRWSRRPKDEKPRTGPLTRPSATLSLAGGEGKRETPRSTASTLAPADAAAVLAQVKRRLKTV